MQDMQQRTAAITAGILIFILEFVVKSIVLVYIASVLQTFTVERQDRQIAFLAEINYLLVHVSGTHDDSVRELNGCLRKIDASRLAEELHVFRRHASERDLLDEFTGKRFLRCVIIERKDNLA